MPKVSVIIPTFNNALFISEAIESVIKQTFTDFEVIVVDDGSTDNTKEVLSRYTDTRIRYIYQENKGPSVARNNGVRTAVGEYIAFLDSDDLCLPERLAIQISFLEANPKVDIVHSACFFIDKNGKTVDGAIKNPAKKDKNYFESLVSGEEGFIFSSITMRKRCFDLIGLFDERLKTAEDLDMILRLLLQGNTLSYIDKPLIKYRVNVGISSDAKKVEENMKLVLDKYFCDNRASSKTLSLKNKAYCNHLYYECCWYYYYKKDLSGWKEHLIKAIELYPEMMKKTKIFYEWFLNLMPFEKRSMQEVLKNLIYLEKDISDFLEHLYSHPGLPKGLSSFKKATLANYHITCGVLYYLARNMKESRRHFKESFCLKPKVIFNALVVTTFMKSLLGQKIIEKISTSSFNRC